MEQWSVEKMEDWNNEILRVFRERCQVEAFETGVVGQNTEVANVMLLPLKVGAASIQALGRIFRITSG